MKIYVLVFDDFDSNIFDSAYSTPENAERVRMTKRFPFDYHVIEHELDSE